MRRHTYPGLLVIAAAAMLLILAVCATALAAHPSAGKTYAGDTSAPAVNGHRAPVSFRVSNTGRGLLGFSYGNIGCTAMSTLKGNPYTSAAYVVKVGTITASGSGFSVTNAKTTYSKAGKTYVTVSTVAIKFTSATNASGTVSFSQTISVAGQANNSCGPYELSFTATDK